MHSASSDGSWRSLGIVAAALLLPPLVPAVALPYLTPIVTGPDYPIYEPLGVLFFYFAALWACIVFGIPAFVVLRKFKLVRWWSACLAGVVIGGGIALAVGRGQAPLTVAVSWGGTGSLAALVFWFVALPRSSKAHEV